MRGKIYAQFFSWLFILYFAYGSNMDLAQMQRRCPDSRLIGPAFLNGWRLTFDKNSPLWGGGIADIVKDENSQVWGLLYEVSEDDLKALDTYEGAPDFYRRVKVTVIDSEAASHKALAYEVVNKENFTPPSAEYLNIIKSAAEKFNFPDSYKEELDKIEMQGRAAP
jgi:gamma-glutamylcyclotransferase (GGCT)/AIG2-like uncharacterized protein YtfP